MAVKGFIVRGFSVGISEPTNVGSEVKVKGKVSVGVAFCWARRYLSLYIPPYPPNAQPTVQPDCLANRPWLAFVQLTAQPVGFCGATTCMHFTGRCYQLHRPRIEGPMHVARHPKDSGTRVLHLHESKRLKHRRQVAHARQRIGICSGPSNVFLTFGVRACVTTAAAYLLAQAILTWSFWVENRSSYQLVECAFTFSDM
jgi:hypothetical protein